MSNINILKIVLCCLFIVTCIPTASSEPLAESDHPYANNFEYTWTISEPGAAQIRLHFEYLKLAKNKKTSLDYDKLILYDKYDRVLAIYGDGMWGVNSHDFWTEWYTGDTLKVKLVTDSSGTANGFIIDKTETRINEKSEPPRFVDEISSNPSGSSSSEDPKPKQTEDFRLKQAEKTKNENEGKTSASVQLYGEKTDITLGEDILLRLSAVNLITKPTMHVQVILLPPSGMSVTSSEFIQSGAGQYTTTYELEPGAGKDIEVRIKSNQIGDFDVNGRVIYYFEGDLENAEDHKLILPIKVKEGTPSNLQSIPSGSENNVKLDNENKSLRFGSVTALLGLLTICTLEKRML
ncbi:MAG: CUB domain-containing protein [Methanosarcina sp.]|nr:CUB domain-containing protein [Methanosarcina sp.]